MKKICVLLLPLALLVSCGESNPSPPQVEGLFLSEASVTAGEIETTSVTFWVSAEKIDGEYFTDPQSVVLNLPIGVSYVAGTSEIGYQGPRQPDAIVNCPDGTQSLVYNLLPGEVEDPYDFSDFTAVINVSTLVLLPADQREAQAAASLTPFPNPCAVDYQNQIKYFVSGS